MNKSEQLIACLEVEIAKRDEELAACRVAVENCEVFRARIAELEAKYLELASLSSRISVELPIAYALPVSEAKAQGVVQWPEADEIMQMAFEEGQPADDASGYCFELEEFDLFIERLMSEVARLNAAPVQQVVPDASTKMQWPEIVALVNEVLGCEAHKYPCERGSIGHEMTGINFNSLARIIDRVRYAAAPAAPAADAGLVLEQAMYALIGIGYHENSGLVHELRQSLAAHSAKGVV